MGAPLPSNELDRLQCLARYSILDTLPEEAFDRITELTAMCLDVPVAIINFVDEDRQWGKSCYGVVDTEAPREDSFCAWAILHDDVMVVNDAHEDERFRANPMVLGSPHIHLYAGAPLVTPDGFHIGTLCVTDNRPHPFGERERQILRRLAVFVMNELELRRQTLEAERQAAAHGRLAQEYRQARTQAQTLLAISELVGLDLDRTDLLTRTSELLAQTIPLSWVGLLGDPLAVPAHQTVWAQADWNGQTPAPELRDWITEQGLALNLGEDTFRDAPADLVPDGRPLRVGWLPLLEIEEDAPLLTLCVARSGGQAWTYAERQLLRAAARCLQTGLQRDRQLEESRREARLDALTGLLNRRAYTEHLGRATQRGGRPFALVVIDLDGLKKVNDTAGHAGGDALLRRFSQALRDAFREQDPIFRLGGDEFTVLVTEADRWGIVALLDEWIAARVDQAVLDVRQAGFDSVGASVGVALWPHEGPAAEVVQRLADERMYERKLARRAVVLS